MIKLFFILALLVVGTGSFAAEQAPTTATQAATNNPYPPQVTTWQNMYGYTPAYLSTPQATCDATVAWYYGGQATPNPVVKVTNIKYSCTGKLNGGAVDLQFVNAKTPYCLSGDTYDALTDSCSGLTCPDGFIQSSDRLTCTKKQCPAGWKLNTLTNMCVDVCNQYIGVENNEGMMIDPAKFQSYCDSSSCAWVFARASAKPTGYVINGLAYPAYDVWSKGAGLCSDANVSGQKDGSKSKDPKPTAPPCGDNEGVLTSSSGKVACVPEGTTTARKPEVKKTESKETKPNGEIITTEKKTVTDPATGATWTSTTSTSSTDGTTTKVENSGGNGTGGTGLGDNSGNEPGECAKEPDSPMCRKGTVKEKGKFGTDQDAKLEEAKAQLTAKFNEIRTNLQGALSASVGAGGGSLPCPPPITVLGRQISVCVNNYADQLSVIGSIIVFAAAIIAILLVVTA